MAKFVIGRKSGMTQLFDENGRLLRLTATRQSRSVPAQYARSS